MQMTNEGLALIKEFEGFRGTAYVCPSGALTIGYGHTSQAGPPAVTSGMTLSESDAAIVLKTDVERFAAAVRKASRRELTDPQFSALVSFAYNVGTAAFAGSSVLKAVNAGDFSAVPRRLQLWVKGGGHVLPGLVKRRAAEAAMFLGSAVAGGGAASEGVTATPVQGVPPFRSTTVISAVAGALTSLASGAIGVSSGAGPMAAILSTLGVAAASWIVREGVRKAREDGL